VAGHQAAFAEELTGLNHTNNSFFAPSGDDSDFDFTLSGTAESA
jgi:hypothetical protein